MLWDRKSVPEGAVELAGLLEGCELEAYRDSSGVWTIGYGDTIGPDGHKVRQGDRISKPQALELLRRSLSGATLQGVCAAISAHLDTIQVGPIFSLCRNIGAGALRSSTLAKRLNSEDLSGAAQQFSAWVRDGSGESLGLMRRRELERRMFLGAPLHPTYEEVWELGYAQLAPLTQLALAAEET